MYLLRQTHYNHAGTKPTTYCMVLEPCNQSLVHIVCTQLLKEVWDYMQRPKYQDEMANLVFDILAMSLKGSGVCG